MEFGQTSLSGVRRGFMHPQLKTKQVFGKVIHSKTFEKRGSPKPFGQTKNGLISGRLACATVDSQWTIHIGSFAQNSFQIDSINSCSTLKKLQF
jgi:hypothetical protein